MEKLDFLINYLIKEKKKEYCEEKQLSYEEKRLIYRSLCNIRNPLPISEEYIKIENEFLKEESNRKGVKEAADIDCFTKINKTQICLWRGDITTLKIDAIVNAANSKGIGCFIPCHRCIDNAIHSASGISLRLECNEVMNQIGILKTGQTFITSAYNLPSKYVIHTVGPVIYSNVTEKDILELKNCYINSLKIASENNIKEIAFPCISTGEFRFPKKMAANIALNAVKEYLNKSDVSIEKVVFNVFSEEDYKIYAESMVDIYGRI